MNLNLINELGDVTLCSKISFSHGWERRFSYGNPDDDGNGNPYIEFWFVRDFSFNNNFVFTFSLSNGTNFESQSVAILKVDNVVVAELKLDQIESLNSLFESVNISLNDFFVRLAEKSLSRSA